MGSVGRPPGRPASKIMLAGGEGILWKPLLRIGVIHCHLNNEQWVLDPFRDTS